VKIAQVVHLYESVPPQRYGGTERMVSYLTEELVRLGHEVILFGSGDSVTAARLEPICPQAFRRMPVVNRDGLLVLLLEQGIASPGDVDIVHSHLGYLAFPLIRRSHIPVISTLHGRMDDPEGERIYYEFPEIPLVSISDFQRSPCPLANWKGTVYHGLPRDLYRFYPESGRYLAFLGRMSPEKAPDAAIQLAKMLDMPLRMAAKVDPEDREYFQASVAPALSDPRIEYVGEITDAEKNDLLGNACAVVCPYDPEPFGLVHIEALACGTPVLAYLHGSCPELISDGVTGFLCRNLAEMAIAATRIGQIDRRRCRRSFEERFTVERMAKEYLEVYRRVLIEASRKNASCEEPSTSPSTRAISLSHAD
jgi:glycosyltransferase involved in cell wall biosynthesis